jgi:hypothetical protein
VTNTESQTDVALSLDRVGDILLEQNDQAGALAAFNEGLAIRRALAAKDATNRDGKAI